MAAEVFHSFVLQLESDSWDAKRVLDRARTKNGPQALGRIKEKVKRSISEYSKKKPKLSMTRKKRDLYQLKNKLLIDDFRRELCGLEMMQCDGVSSTINYHANRCRLIAMELSFIQPKEANLNTHLEKYEMRLTGYPRTLLDNLHERPENEEGKNSAIRIWNIQRKIAAIIGGEKYEGKAIEKPTTLLEMLNFLHLGEVMFSRDFNRVENIVEHLDKFFMYCVEILQELYDWRDDRLANNNDNDNDTAVEDATLLTTDDLTTAETVHNESDVSLLPLILCQCMHTLRCILMMDCGFLRNRGLDSSEAQRYSIWLAEVLSKWMDEMNEERSQPLCGDDSILTGHVSYFSSLVADTLFCTKCLLQIMGSDSGAENLYNGIGRPYAPPIKLLIRSAERLAHTTLMEVSNHLMNERRVCKGDLMCMESLYFELHSCLSFITACFTVGWTSDDQLEMLAIAKVTCGAIRRNLSIQSSWMQAILCGVLFINMSTEKVESDEEYTARIKQAQIDKLQGRSSFERSETKVGIENLKPRLCEFLSQCVRDVLKIMEIFVSTTSIVHTGLLFVRLVLRLPYMNKKELETFIEGERNAQTTIEELRAERMMKLKEEHNTDDLDDDDISVEDFYMWKEKNLDEDDAFLNNWKDGASKPISDLLYAIGNSNIQSLEVVEQWLLLVRHLCISSGLARVSLVEACVEDAIAKIITIQNTELYTIALCRICLNELKKADS